MSGWGNAIGKIFDWLPGREESLRNTIQKIHKEMSKLEKEPASADNTQRYSSLVRQLCEAESKLQNR